ncbi:MAG: DNA mismatch repair protein MutS [Isosphaeraceae bacterium]
MGREDFEAAARRPDEAGPAVNAREDYRRRLDQRRATRDRLGRIERRLADARLVVFTAALVVLAVALRSGVFSWAWTLVPAFGYLVLIVLHDRTRRASARTGRAIAYYERGLSCLDGTWHGKGQQGDRFLDVEHPYAADLDLFGSGSIFERVCTARTRAGEETIARWLLTPAEPAIIRARQEAVAEFRDRVDLREEIELIGAEVREGIDPDALAAWGREPRAFTGRAALAAAYVLAVLGASALVAWAVTDIGLSPLFLVILIDVAYSYAIRKKVRSVVGTLDRRTHDLVILAELLSRLEREPARTAFNLGLKEGLECGGEPASRRIARLARLVQYLESQNNQFLAPFAALLMWRPIFAHAIDAWRAATGPRIAGWLAAVGDFETVLAFSAYSYENPEDPFPEIDEAETCFVAEDAGHPLLLASACVRNDVRLGGDLRVLLVSGSNMSGKSTLLRTVGANAVLALAGAPVRAKSLRISVLSIGATLRIQDSLQAGKSRFYAEITRVRQLVGLAEGRRPLLFLLDEVFHGTNSHDRVVGAGAVVRGLIERGAIGLVTTHDLALAQVAETLAPRALNVHFEDQLVDGTMKFDYRMRPGVVQHSNALALMRAVGLEV